MDKNVFIAGKEIFFSLDSYKTQLNNNVLVVGASGAGKSRSIVEPNLLQATGSYVLSDPKGLLYKKYGNFFKEQGYEVKLLDFTQPEKSSHYNFFNYINNYNDVTRVAHALIFQQGLRGHVDPFWDEASKLLLQSIISYLLEQDDNDKKNLQSIFEVLALIMPDNNSLTNATKLDNLMNSHGILHEDSFAVKTYRKFRIAADKTIRSILISVNARLGVYDTPTINALMSNDEINIPSIGQRKTIIFVGVSDTDRSLDGLVNIFFTQAMQELCNYADRECKDGRLPVPVRFILDDFATNCKINDFPRMISSFRSREIAAMILLQAESQLQELYDYDGQTIIANCDTYIYLGTNDVGTAKKVAERCDVPLKKILYMSVGTNWIFRRGQQPVNGTNFELEPFFEEKMQKKRINKNKKEIKHANSK